MEPNNSPVPQVQDRRSRILGVLPKNAQARVLGGIALLMVIIITLTGRNTPKEHPARPMPMMPEAVDPNQGRIQEYRARLEEQTQKLAAEETELARTKDRMDAPSAPQASSHAAGLPAGSPPLTAPQTTEATMASDREKREYQSLFASNIALSYRPPPLMQPLTPATPGPNVVTLALPPSAQTGTASGTTGPKTAAKYRLFEGTVIETVLTNRLDASFSGPVNCMATTNVYSRDGQTLLIPQGTRLLGEVRKVDSLGQQRLAVAFHRLIMPDGFSVNLDQFQGLDQIGETGLRDQVNHHYLQVFGVSLAIGAFAGLSQINTRYGVDESAGAAYAQGVSNSLSQSALHILDRYLNVLPTFTIREGYRVKVYLSQDLLLSAYDQHPLRQDL